MITALILVQNISKIPPKITMWSANGSNMWSKGFFEVRCGWILLMRWGGKPLKNGRKHEISGEKQRKKEILTNLLFGLCDKT